VLQGGGRHWNITWRRQPFLWEVNLIANLMALLEDVTFNGEVDKWMWMPDEDGLFSVKSTYVILQNILLVDDGVGDLEKGFFFFNLEESGSIKDSGVLVVLTP